MKVLKLNFNIVLAKEEYKNYLLMMLFCLVKLLVVWMHLREDQVRKLLDFHYMETTTVKRGIHTYCTRNFQISFVVHCKTFFYIGRGHLCLKSSFQTFFLDFFLKSAPCHLESKIPTFQSCFLKFCWHFRFFFCDFNFRIDDLNAPVYSIVIQNSN